MGDRKKDYFAAGLFLSLTGRIRILSSYFGFIGRIPVLSVYFYWPPHIYEIALLKRKSTQDAGGGV